MTVMVDKRIMQRIVRDTQKGIAQMEEGLALMSQNETPAAYAILSQSWIELLERRRREIAERLMPTDEELERAHQVFEQRERRAIFYDLTQTLLRDGAFLNGAHKTAAAICTLLFVWSEAYYRYHLTERHAHWEALERLLRTHKEGLCRFRRRRVETLKEEDKAEVTKVFAELAEVLGAIGAAKALHILAPHFFPLWDNKIAKAYGLPRRLKATPQEDAERYWRFMQIVKWQVRLLKERKNLPEFVRANFLKALDEWNYAKFTKGWL